jgi:DNA-binding transcriptional ArsR family regulator
MAQQSTPLDGVFLALSDPTRRAVLARLGAGAASIGELAEPFDMALPSFMKHIRYLENTGWIKTRKTGRVRTCTLEGGSFEAVYGWLAQQRDIWEERTDRLERLAADADATKEEK